MITGRSIQTAARVMFFCMFLVACGGDGNSFVITGNQGGGGNESAADSDGTGTGNQDSDVTTPPEPDVPTPSDPIVLPPPEPIITLSGPLVVSTLSEPDGVPFEELMVTSLAAEAFGTVVDSPVSGLRYKSGNHYGITDSAGTYGYLQGETVEFFIGDIRIGHAVTPSARVTPYELANSDPQVALNIARFLQSLDNDGQTDNGIHIHDAVHTLAAGIAIDFASEGWQQPSYLLVDGGWVPRQTDIELLVAQLTSATEAGARDLLSADTAMGHLSLTLGHLIHSLGQQAEAVLSASTCETDSQCKWTRLSAIPSRCSGGDKQLVYSDVNADLPAFALLEAQRVYLIDMHEKLRNSAWGPDRTTGSCMTLVTMKWAICGESNHCEITTALPRH